jgi:tetratricopeptide (TPR) repeat protein
MYCSKNGGECPHNVLLSETFVFVIMPFAGFNSVYDAIRIAVEGITDRNFQCERADEKYTHLAIWCHRICKNIRKAKYLIVDTTGRNANVFYELGFTHAMAHTKALIITQKLEEAPFDIADINHIVYSEKDLPKLREDLKKAFLALETEEEETSYRSKSADEIMVDLKSQLRAEEGRSEHFKKELVETEERERKLKSNIQELESIIKNPVAEAENQVAAMKETITQLNERIKLVEKDKNENIEQLNRALQDKEAKLRALEKKLANRVVEGPEVLSGLLLDEAGKRAEAEKWFNKANEAKKVEKNLDLALKYYSKAIELNPEYVFAYNNRGLAYSHLKEYDKAISDYNRAIELNPEHAKAYYNRGVAYSDLKEYGKAISDYNKAIELNPEHAPSYENLTELYIIYGDCQKALQTITRVLSFSLDLHARAVSLYLEFIARKMLNLDTSACEAELNGMLKKDFQTGWSFSPIEARITETNLDYDKKAVIIAKTEQLKKHILT